MRTFYVCLAFLFCRPAFANFIVKQTITNAGDVMRSTQYFSGPMFRGDLKTKDMEFISIVNFKTFINCQRPNSSGEKWSCTKGDIEQIGTVMGVAKIKVRDQKLKKTQENRQIHRSILPVLSSQLNS